MTKNSNNENFITKITNILTKDLNKKNICTKVSPIWKNSPFELKGWKIQKLKNIRLRKDFHFETNDFLIQEKKTFSTSQNDIVFPQVLNKKERIEKIREEYHNTTPSQLHTEIDSESIFTKRFIDMLQKKLGEPEEFKKLNRAEQITIADNVHSLLVTETSWKGITASSKYEEKLIKKMFGTAFKRFNYRCSNLFFPHGKKMHHSQVRGKFASSKCEVFYKHFLDYLKKKSINKKLIKIIENNQNQINFTNLTAIINTRFLFYDLVKICMKKAFDQSINIEQKDEKGYHSRVLDNPFLFVKQTTLLYSMQEVISVYLANQVLSELEDIHAKDQEEKQDKLIWSDPGVRLSFIYNFFSEHKKELMLKKKKHAWYIHTFDITMVLIDIFADTDVVLKRETLPTPDKQQKETVILWLSHIMENTIPFSHHVPRITPPKRIDADTNVDSYVKKLLKGNSIVSVSETVRKTLNISQKKKMLVNTTFLSILNEMHNKSVEKLVCGDFIDEYQNQFSTPFPTSQDLVIQRNKVQQFDDALPVNVLQKYITKKAFATLCLKKAQKTDNKRKYNPVYDSLSIANVSQVEQDLKHKGKLLGRDLLSCRAKRQLLQTSIHLAEVYQGFPIYYGTKLDYRTRLYPWEYLLSRTSGKLKHLLMDYKQEALTRKGVIHLMTAYYRFSLQHSLEFRDFLKKNNLRKKKVMIY